MSELKTDNLDVQPLFDLLCEAKQCDVPRLKKKLIDIKKKLTLINQQKQSNSHQDKQNEVVKLQKSLTRIHQDIIKSSNDKASKLASLPNISFPDGLPISDSAERIGQAIVDNQVVIIAGETGSGKTTQIPKICLALGRGVNGLIGHTQPRRIAARTVANRIAEELGTKLGDQVGYKVRFNDQVSERSYIKLMTDGILLAEMQKDRLLRQYDTIIIDEAHERSLNIDFILGYLKQILFKRPDLKVIITSATIDPERFAKHFASKTGVEAPIIEVSGRTYPVEIRYRPLNDDSQEDETLSSSNEGNDIVSGIINAVDELSHESHGDILIFLNGEREIRDTAAALSKANLQHTQILPLYARLTIAEQNRIFKPHSGRNIVLATNVAETSLTVPGIKYVIDPGTARISRYSYRTKVQRLPIEAISQASANQRAGRCGRVSEGICIRLYSEEDFINRDEFTDPEILRTNLATVILQMLALDLGDISQFPFVEPPDSRNINDGVRLLEELAAIKPSAGNKKHTNQSHTQLTKSGRLLSKFPIDPRLAKMVLSAIDFGCLEQVLIIVSALSIQDPRERPHEKQQASDEKHSRFKDKQSDFISLLNLWCYVTEQQGELSQNQFRKLCQKEYLSYVRIREWQDIFSQLKLTLKEQKIALSTVDYHFKVIENPHQKDKKHSADQNSDKSLTTVHQALLSGLLSHLGQQDENREFKGARGSKFFVFPGSALAKKPPKWLMSAELVETSRLFARMNAKIDPLWIEPLAKHLIKKSYSEPHWEKKQGAVMAFEQVTLYGLVIVGKRKVNFNQIEPDTCRQLFIQEALVHGDSFIKEEFLKHNQALVASIEKLEQKARRKDFLIDDQQLIDFYLDKTPDSVICQRSFLAWWKKEKQQNPKLLNFTKAFLLNETSTELSKKEYPDTWQQQGLTLPLKYHFSPGDLDDGISVVIPIALLNQVQIENFDWLIPALRFDLAVSLIKALPKTLRRNFVPAPNYAQACLDNMLEFEGNFKDSLAKQLLRMTGVKLPDDAWDNIVLPVHLTMNFQIVNEQGKVLNQGRDLHELKVQLQGKVKASIKKVAEKGIEKTGITQWDFNSLPKGYEKKVANISIKAFPALVDNKTSVAIELFEQEEHAEQAMLAGITRLILLNIPSPIKYLQQKLPNKAKLGLYFNPFGSINELLEDCIQAACNHLVKVFMSAQDNKLSLPRTEQDFKQCSDFVRAEIADAVLAAAIKVEQALSLRHDIGKKLKGNVSLNVIQSHGDIKHQSEQLIFKGFVNKNGIAKLDDIIRYLKGILRRLEKLPIDPNQDRLKLIEVSKVQEAYDALIAKQRKDKPLDIALLETRWMIEELRISLFAQNLGTAAPISVKRILNHLKTIAI
ncbi:ATP-dependent RNA helicase HrpA [Litorilituus lipolyticus]|uniref:RNA helicase n=1 Tax=Litorilituus lipolyticus TaxID=2491017 RepID=A0A502KS28_9GAMM|nr:ATP-dependent RNA helicase HrpA [Litorilituus lipolyticus]TPH14438.1 ATP-dependent RNA helicase HrpA [Litorilituus lipolyticus]